MPGVVMLIPLKPASGFFDLSKLRGMRLRFRHQTKLSDECLNAYFLSIESEVDNSFANYGVTFLMVVK